MKRRSFVKRLALASLGTPILMDNLFLEAISKPLFQVASSAEDRVLIIIRLNGGNDGLNTVIPLDQYSNLTTQRSNILIPQSSILNISTDLGFHPVMTGMKNMFSDGKLGVIQNVGYPEQNRSHFRSMDIWSSGLIDAPATTGWLGRHFDNSYPNYPTGYPNATYPDPFAISMGYDVSTTCQGISANFSHAVNNPFDSYNLTSSNSVNDGTYYGSQIEYLSLMIDQANEYGSEINAAANNGNTLSTMYDPNNPLAVQLQYVAQMISGGLKSKVYILNVNGFDTHDSQVSATDKTQGDHADLMKRVSDAVAAFQDDLSLLGLEDRVAGMTFSEFGRQIASNASLGTDHGDAAPLFLFGTCLDFSVLGSNPVISNTVVDQAGVPMQIDFRDVYASILKDWFGVSTSDIQALFEQQVTYYSLLGACSVGVEEQTTEKDLIIYPNPSYGNSTVKFVSANEKIHISVYDLSGRMVKVVFNGKISSGIQNVPIDISELSNGEYFVRIRKDSGELTSKLLKIG